MARKKGIKAGTLVGIGFGAIVIIVLLDHFVLRGKLGIAGRLNQLIGKLKFKTGQQSMPPIEAAVPTQQPGLPSGSLEFEGSSEEAALLEEEALLAGQEPETAFRGRRRFR